MDIITSTFSEWLKANDFSKLFEAITDPASAFYGEALKRFQSKEGQQFLNNLLSNFRLSAPTNSPAVFSELQKLDKSKLKHYLQTKNEVYDSDSHFPGFDSRHIAFTGATGSGKTTALNLLICKGQLDVPREIYVFMSSMAMTGENSFYSKTAQFLTFQFQKQSNSNSPPNIYVFLDTEQELSSCIEAIRASDNSEKKLLIVEDVRVAGENVMKKYVQPFLLGAKNANCQAIFMDHVPSRDTLNYESCGYVVMCEPTQQTYNIITQNKRSVKTIDTRFNNLQTLERKAAIFDKKTNNLYWVFSNLPLIRAY